MPLVLKFEALPGYARANVSGDGSIGEFLRILRQVSAVSAHAQAQLVLDLRELHGLEKLTEQMTAGVEAAGLLGHLRRIAVLEPAARVTHNGERAARRLGLDLRVFSANQEAQAVAWLHGAERSRDQDQPQP